MTESPPRRSGLQESIFRALEGTNPALADLYEGARRLAAMDPPPPGSAWFLAHAIREIVDAIPALEDVGRPDDRIDYGRRIDEIAGIWRPLGLLEIADGDGMSKDVPSKAITAVAALVRDADLQRNRRERLRRTFAQRATGVGPTRHDAWAKECKALYEENARRAHTGKPWPTPRGYQDSFRKLEIVLAGIFGEYAPNRRELDAILAAANRRREQPTAEETGQIAYLTARLEEQRYFFTRLENPLWIDALYDAGHVAPAQPGRIDNATRYLPRLITQYIARVAGSHPDHAFVARVLADLSETDDPLVQSDIMRAMSALDPQLLTDLLPAVARWVASGERMFLRPELLGGLVVHALHDPRNAESVRTILDAVFEPQWDRSRDPSLASLRMGEWDVSTFTKNVLPEIVKLDGTLLLGALLRSLEGLLTTKFPNATEVAGVRDDESAMWLSDLTDDQHLYEAHDSITHLVVRTLDALAASQDASHHDTAVEMLECGGWAIHRRLGLRFLARCDVTPAIHDKIVVKLTNPSLASAYQTRHEYDALLRAVFANVAQEEQRVILSTLESAAEAKGDHASLWLYERIAHISNHLTGDWAQRFDDYAEQFGEPRHLPPVSWISQSGTIDDQSPLSADDAGAMEAAQLAAFAREWAMPDTHQFDRPTWRGLAKHVEYLAEQRPGEFSVAAPSFVDVNRTVVAGLLRGLKNAVSKGDAIDWPSTLALANVVATKNESRDKSKHLSDEAVSWSEAKHAAADLLQAGLRGQVSPPLELRAELWETIELMAAHGATPDIVDLDDAHDSVFYALNATRSQAAYTSVAYLLWLRRHGAEGVPAIVDAFFRRILNPENERFIGMRAAVAEKLPLLAHVDADWATDLLPAIFPNRAAYPEHWDAAWNAYIRYARPLPDEPLLTAMEDEYAIAVGLVEASPDDVPLERDHRVHLGIHLARMFLNGICELDHQNLTAFFRHAPARVRARVVNWIGRGASQGGLPDVWLARAQEFFEWCEQRGVKKEGDGSELREFKWFVASGAFPAKWWAPRLPRSLRADAALSDDPFVPPDMLEQVATASANYPEMALEVLGIAAKPIERGWHEPYLGSAEAILTNAAAVPSLSAQVRDVADQLARAGHEQFERFAPHT